MKQGKNPRLKILHPKARSPPSAKNRAWTVRMDAMVRKAACGPSRIARIIPPPKCPLEPVPGIEKLIIWAAKMNAPRTPMSGALLSSMFSLSFLALYAVRPAVTAHIVPPTAGEISASAMCMTDPPQKKRQKKLSLPLHGNSLRPSWPDCAWGKILQPIVKSFLLFSGDITQIRYPSQARKQPRTRDCPPRLFPENRFCDNVLICCSPNKGEIVATPWAWPK